MNFEKRIWLKPFYSASYRDNPELIQLLIDHHAKIDEPEGMASGLHMATTFQQLGNVKVFLKNGANINTKGADLMTPLYYCLLSPKAKYSIVDYLIIHGANVNICDSFGTSPLNQALATADPKIVKRLIPLTNSNLLATTEPPVLVWALNQNEESLFDMLLRRGVNVNSKSSFGETALPLALKQGYVDFAKKLIAHGADVNASLSDGTTPMQYAVRKGNSALVSLLHSRGAKVDLPNKEGITPLMDAARLGDEKIVRILLLYGANRNIKDSSLRTAKQWAAISGYNELATIL